MSNVRRLNAVGPLHHAQLEVFADYHQFYVQDGEVFPDAPTDWTDADIQRRVKVAENVVVVCPLRDMTVPVEVEVLAAEPEFNLAEFDHVARCSLSLPSGILQVHECTGGERLRLAVEPGMYAVLVLFSQLSSVGDNGLEGKDRYRVLLWRGSESPLTIAKLWRAEEGPS